MVSHPLVIITLKGLVLVTAGHVAKVAVIVKKYSVPTSAGVVGLIVSIPPVEPILAIVTVPDIKISGDEGVV